MTYILYVFIVIIFGYIFGHAISKEYKPLREGARTLPRPVINPPYKIYEKESIHAHSIPGQTMNQFIEQHTNKYFDKDGLPLEKTIQLYVSYCVNQGNVTQENKRKLTDIGYYFLNIVIPNLPTTKQPNPNEYWPPIQWSNHKIFSVWTQPNNTYQVMRGQNYQNSYVANFSNSNNGGGNFFSFFGNLDNSDQYNYNKSPDSDSNNNDNGLADQCDNKPQSACGIGCPSSCLSSAFAAAASAQQNEDSQTKGRSGAIGDNLVDSYDSNGSNQNYNSNKGTGNTTFLPGGQNVLVIGSAKLDGYVITDEPQTSTSTTLNDQINEFIAYYFISSGPNENRPTQYAIDIFDEWKKKQPMDEIHMNKMRDLVYYILQIIIPGLPTESLPRSYVAWRPIVWMSRSEK